MVHHKLRIIGTISLVIGSLFVGVSIHSEGKLSGSDYQNYLHVIVNPVFIVGCFGINIGIMMLIFSLSRKNRIRLRDTMEKIHESFKADCQCCKCQNCDRNHNHWTHD